MGLSVPLVNANVNHGILVVRGFADVRSKGGVRLGHVAGSVLALVGWRHKAGGRR